MLQFLFLIIDVVIVVAFIAGPWVVLTKLNVQWPNWLKDGIVGVIVFVIWAGVALYLATQTIIWLGFVPYTLLKLISFSDKPLPFRTNQNQHRQSDINSEKPPGFQSHSNQTTLPNLPRIARRYSQG